MDENTTNPFASDSQDGAEVEADVVQPTAESILSGLLVDLEGLAHMSKTEVEHVVQAARVAFQSL